MNAARCLRSERVALPALVGILIGFAIGCGEEAPRDEATAFAPPVGATPPTGTWDPGEPTSAEELAREFAEEMRALEAEGSLGVDASLSESDSFTGTAPPPVAFEIQGGFDAGGDGPRPFEQAEVGGVPVVDGTIDESGGGHSVDSIGGKAIELP